jgi:hypothetical protein
MKSEYIVLEFEILKVIDNLKDRHFLGIIEGLSSATTHVFNHFRSYLLTTEH